MIEQLQTIPRDLVAWWNANPKERKDFEKERPARAKADAQALLEERQALVAEYRQALKADADDQALTQLRADLDILVATARHPKTGVSRPEAIPEITKLQRKVSAQTARHRHNITRLRELLSSTAPAEIGQFVEEMRLLDKQTMAVDAGHFDQQYFGAIPGSPSIALASYMTYRPSQLERVEAIHKAIAAAKKCAFEAMTVPELQARFAALRKSIPELKAARFSRSAMGREFKQQ